MKAIMINLTPKECMNLLNEDLSLLVRKDKKLYVAVSNLIKEQGRALIYAYCRKDAKIKLMEEWDSDDNGYGLYFEDAYVCDNTKPKKPKAAERGVLTIEEMWEDYELQMLQYEIRKEKNVNGKVICSFWCDKVEEIVYSEEDCEWKTKSLCFEELLNKSLTHDYLLEYLGDNGGYTIHIATLEKVFDKPKEIGDFYHHFKLKRCESLFGNNNIEIDSNTHGLRQPIRGGYEYVYPLTRAPSNYCYIEI